jgi:hypothetical protein
MSSDTSELILNATALGAVIVSLIGVGRHSRSSTLAQRLKILYGLLSAFFALRLVQMVYPNAAFNGAILLVAAWLPYAQLRLGEEIVRFHAPRHIKIVTLGGAVCFSCLTVFSGFLPGQQFLIGLALFQCVTFASVIFLLFKHRSDVSVIDRGVADTFVLALLIGVPLAMTDFRELVPNTPVRGGAFGMLIMVLATSHFASASGTPRALLKDISIILLAGAIVALMIIWSGLNLSLSDIIKITACAMATTSLAILIERFRTDRDTGSTLIRALGQTRDGQNRTSLLGAHPLLSQSHMLDATALAGYPQGTLSLLLQHQILTSQTGTDTTRDAARDLLDRFAASHLMRISTNPPQFLAIAASDLAGPSLDDELMVAARLIEAAR